MRRLLSLGALAAAAFVVALLAQAPPSTSPMGVSAQVVERVGFRKPPPSCEQAIKDLGLEGQPVSCEEPPPPTYDPPQMHGNYRLFPGSYVGPLTYEDSPDTAPPGVASDDLETIKASSMYVEPAWLPDGYALSSINTNGYDSEHVIAATYTGPGEPIEINHVRRSEWPVDIIQPVGDSPAVYETPVLDGVPAVLSYPKPGFPSRVNETLLRFAQGDVESIIVGDHLDPETATQIALSLICGASCVSPPAAAREAVDGAMSGASPQPAVATQQAGVSAADTGTSPASGATAFPTEHRVIAGLGITDVEALYWGAPYNSYWHGWYDYGEKALDLRRPNDSWGTAGLPVYVITWAWSGGGVLNFRTRDYSISTACTGRYVDLTDSGNHTLGSLTYVHLDSMPAPYDTWSSNASGWTIRYVGNVAGSQPGCWWGAPHLHQGQTTSSPKVFHNTAVPDSQGRINPTNPTPPAYNWMFRVLFTAPEDWDGDGCTNSQEAAMGFDAYNYWDFYDVPVPANPDPTPNGPRNRAVNISDVLAVLFYVGAYVNGGPNAKGVDYDSDKDGDWNGDTVINVYDSVGLRYDRSPSGAPNPPWDAGPPDGAINMADVLAVLAQVPLGCS